MNKYAKLTLVLLPALVLVFGLLSVSECQAKTESTTTSEATSSQDTKHAQEMPTDVVFEKDTIQIKRQNGSTLDFNVEIAETAKQRRQGLMYRHHLADNEGMLFLFDDVYKAAFWMKNTFIPLDMLFLHPDGTIHHIHHNAKPQDETKISSEFPSEAVLELPGGVSSRLGISEGDQVLYFGFDNVAW